MDLCDLVFDFLDEESIKNLSLTSHSIAEKCSMMYPIRRSLRLQGLAPAILANNTAFSSSLATPALGNSGNTLSTPSGSGFDSGNELVASTENRRRSPMDLSGGDEKTDSEFESEDDKEYRAQLQVNPEVVASIVQNFPQANTTASLTGLPTELTIMIFGNLDVIDAVCLGLASRRHYNIYSLLFGYGVKLNTRRIGQPGTVERSWEVVGKDQCAHCGSYRCQLYRHINTWMGPNLVSTSNPPLKSRDVENFCDL